MPGRHPTSAAPEALWCAAPILVAALLAAAAPSAPAPPPAAQAKSEPLFAPIDYFARACASCHGPYGSFYGPGFGAGLTDEHLKEKVREMVFGPSQDTLEDPELDRLTAYHRSLVKRTPFLAIVNPSGARLSGEVTPGSTVSVKLGDATRSATVTGHTWTIDLGSAPGKADPVVTAVAAAPGPDGKRPTTSLDLAKSLYTHTDPLPAPPKQPPAAPP